MTFRSMLGTFAHEHSCYLCKGSQQPKRADKKRIKQVEKRAWRRDQGAA